MPGFVVEHDATVNTGVCGQSLCEASTLPMTDGCHSCVTRIYQEDDFCCLFSFDKYCVQMVEPMCDLVYE